MDDAKNQLLERLKTANSVLITVSKNPSVDQLAACIGLTLIVNKMNKHGSAVFSGEVPSTIDFLKPDETIEKTADSLRDFIIALDKSKADKLRYKVEDQMVKIFITPYKTSLSEQDFEFSQGDFNVELIVALGVHQQEDLDSAIMAHGRILHDATVACINTTEQSSLGNITWQDSTASSLCELVTDLAVGLGENVLDEQVSTALLTGIIAETNRFSNEKTSSQTMNVSGKLMSAGANQQLVATNLEEVKSNIPQDGNSNNDAESQENADGTLSIDHENDLDLATLPMPNDNVEDDLPPSDPADLGAILENAQVNTEEETNPNAPRLVTEPPALGGTLTANSVPERYDPSTDPLSNNQDNAGLPDLDNLTRTVIEPLDQQSSDGQPPQPPMPPAPTPEPPQPPMPSDPAGPPAFPPSPDPSNFTPPPPTWNPPLPPPPVVEPPSLPQPPMPPAPTPEPPQPPTPEPEQSKTGDATLEDLEKAVDSPHQNQEELDSAREQVDAVLKSAPDNAPKPAASLNAMPLGEPLHQDESEVKPPEPKKDTIAGLDSSLFSEVPNENEQAPPVPPPLDFNNPTGNS